MADHLQSTRKNPSMDHAAAPGMMTRFQWQFVEVSHGGANRWIWQRIAIDGRIHARSPKDFEDYSAAVHDAVLNAAFSPQSEGWSIITLLGASHFSAGPEKRRIQKLINTAKLLKKRN